VTAADTLK